MTSHQNLRQSGRRKGEALKKQLKLKQANSEIAQRGENLLVQKIQEQSCNSYSSYSDDVDPGVFRNIAPLQASKSKKKSIIKLKKIIESSHGLGNLGQRFNRNELTSLKKFIDSEEQEEQKSNKANHKEEESISEDQSEECGNNDKKYESEKTSRFECFKKLFNSHKDEHSVKTIQRRIRRKQAK